MALESFEPRYFEEIFQDMVNYMLVVAPDLTDYNIGSRIRTYLEAMAFEDDEQYHQMVALLTLWNLDNLRGKDLEERLLEWNIPKLGELQAFGDVIISNNNLPTSFLSNGASVGATTLYALSSAGLPTSGFPYTVRIGEGTANVEDVQLNANNPNQGVLTVDPLTKDHARGARVSLVSGSSLIVPIGTRVRVPETAFAPELTATLTQQAEILAGNYDSNPAATVMDAGGALGNVAPNQVKSFVGASPFDGALVRNETRFTGGRNRESDDQYRARGRAKLQALARGTTLAVRQLLIGLTHTGLDGRTWRIISANVLELFEDSFRDKINVYIWPGAFDFIEIKNITTPEVLTASAEDGQRFFVAANVAIVPNSMIVERYPFGGTGWNQLVLGVDYFVNEGTGKIQIADPGLNSGDQLRILRYSCYTGLLQKAQLALNGAAKNPTVYPGISSAGVKALATFPRPKSIDPIRLSIQVREGFLESEVAPLVANAVSRYIAELVTGEDLILSEIIERAMGVDGMFDVQVQYPTSNIVLLEDEILDTENLEILVF